MTRSTGRWLLTLCLILFSVRVCLYIILLPLNEMPDEYEHIKQITMAQYWDRVKDDKPAQEELMRDVTVEYYFVGSAMKDRPDPKTVDSWVPDVDRSKIYYRMNGALLNLLGVESRATAWYTLRFMSLFYGLAVIILAWATARELVPENPLIAAGTIGFLALLPQFAASCGSISTDKPAELAGALFFYLLIRAVNHDRGREWLAMGFLLAALPFVKRTTFYLVLVAGLAALPRWRVFLARLRRPRLVTRGLPALISLLFLGAAFTPWLGRFAKRILGQPILRIWHPWFERETFGQPGMVNSFIEHIQLTNLSFWHHLYLNIQSLFQSWWGTYGFLTLPLQVYWYWAAWGLTLLALGGWFKLLYRPGRDDLLAPWQGRAVGLLAIGAVLNLGLILVRQVVFTPGVLSQGRYMFPSLVPWVILGLMGYLALWPRRFKAPALVGALFVVAAMDLAGQWRVIVPHFYYIIP